MAFVVPAGHDEIVSIICPARVLDILSWKLLMKERRAVVGGHL